MSGLGYRLGDEEVGGILVLFGEVMVEVDYILDNLVGEAEVESELAEGGDNGFIIGGGNGGEKGGCLEEARGFTVDNFIVGWFVEEAFFGGVGLQCFPFDEANTGGGDNFIVAGRVRGHNLVDFGKEIITTEKGKSRPPAVTHIDFIPLALAIVVNVIVDEISGVNEFDRSGEGGYLRELMLVTTSGEEGEERELGADTLVVFSDNETAGLLEGGDIGMEELVELLVKLG